MECQHEFRFHQTAGSPEVAIPVCLRQWLLDGTLPMRVAWAAAVTFSCLILGLKLFFFSDAHLHAVQRWAARPWVAANCSVLASGVSYVGDCEVGRREPAHAYADCRPAVHSCRGPARAAGSARRLGSLHVGEGRSFGQDGPHRADGAADGSCLDAFLPWALLAPHDAGPERCGYARGLASESRVRTWAEAQSAFGGAGASVPCWLLDAAGCSAVALEAPSAWPEAAPMGAWQRWARPALALLALAFLVVGAHAAVARRGCRCQWQALGAATALRDVPRRSWGFRAGAEYRPVPHGAGCMELG